MASKTIRAMALALVLLVFHNQKASLRAVTNQRSTMSRLPSEPDDPRSETRGWFRGTPRAVDEDAWENDGSAVVWSNTVNGVAASLGLKPRGVVLLRATQVPIPEDYKKAFGKEGKNHDKMILDLVASIRKHSPFLPVVVVVDDPNGPRKDLLNATDGYILKSFAGNNTSNSKKPWREKIPALLSTPFNETMYMDSDMVVCEDVEHLFLPLASSEMGLTRLVPQSIEHAWNRAAFKFDYYSNFLMFRKTPRVQKLLKAAAAIDTTDQEALNAAFWDTTKSKELEIPTVFTFPGSANAFCRSLDLILPVTGPVYTMHGMEAQCGKINEYKGARYLRCVDGEIGFDVLKHQKGENGEGLMLELMHPATPGTTAMR